MNIPEVTSREDQAIDVIVTVLNNAKSRLNMRLNLSELASSRELVGKPTKVPLSLLQPPMVKNCKKFLADTIEEKWRLTPTFMYITKMLGSSTDESSHYYYYESIFSQPTVSYPIPHATASVFFRLQLLHTGPPYLHENPMMTFRIEGHHTDNDIRFVTLTPDALLAVLMMKIKFSERIEKLNLF